MGVMYYILSPFSWLLNFFYSFTDSYGISLILFALDVYKRQGSLRWSLPFRYPLVPPGGPGFFTLHSAFHHSA